MFKFHIDFFFTVFTGAGMRKGTSSPLSLTSTVKIENVMFLPFLPEGRSFFFYHIRGKNGKNRKFSFFTVFTGGPLLFLLPYPR